MSTTPSVLFLCTHNAGRSQMALGFFAHYAGDRAVAFSGGSTPADAVNPAAVQAMAERGIDISGEHPRRWTEDIVLTNHGLRVPCNVTLANAALATYGNVTAGNLNAAHAAEGTV